MLPLPGTLLAVVGPGTGLGVGAVLRTRAGWQAVPGEGGHATLAATDRLEAEVIAVVRRQYPHVSAERLLSGIGLPLLHQAVAAVSGQASEALSAEQVVERGVAGSCAVCRRTLEVFCALLGGFAGNVALTLGARGGVYIGGGIAPQMIRELEASGFRAQFEGKGRFRDYLSGIPVYVIETALPPALAGAGRALDLGL